MIKQASGTTRSDPAQLRYILGLDLGPASIGWAVVKCSAKGKPNGLIDCGVRRFDAGVTGDIESGRDEPKAMARRNARGPRRQTWRRKWRLRKVYRLLAFNKMLPQVDDSPTARHQALIELDKELRQQYLQDDQPATLHLLPYILRARALDEELSKMAFGRAIYHLAQRRGYRSNRKTEQSDEDRGVVAEGISRLEEQIADAGVRTVGEYFSTLDPEENRIRRRWTARHMFHHEFNLIWDAQAKFQPEVYNDELKQQIHDTIFHQRHLKSQKNLIGKCQLEPKRRRAPLACVPFQEFRMLQRVNDLEIIAPDGEVLPLDNESRDRLVDRLNRDGDLSWAKVRTLLKLTKKSRKYGRGYRFNFEEGGDKKMVGNRTAAKLRKHIPDIWDGMSPTDQIAFVDEILSFESEPALARRLGNVWDLDNGQADAVSRTVLEQGYASHSRKAINQIRPRLRQGDSYSTIRREIYPETFASSEPVDLLPPVLEVSAFAEIRNPSVVRTLSEVRKVVNELIRLHGKPMRVRIELARDLKHARKRREEFAAIRDRNEKARKAAAKRIVEELRDESYLRNHSNILKVRLAEECGWVCPYSGDAINMKKLVASPQFEIEHIIPYSRCFDNSFVNKTLCRIDINRDKGNQTPYEAFNGTDAYPKMLDRVRQFQGGLANRKLALFMREHPLPKDQFTERMLNDTRYTSKKACEYLGLLFGGVIDADGKRVVQALPGRCTSNLRNNWDLNAILGHPAKKERGDHRHHAIDAVVIAVTSASLVRKMSQAAESAEQRDSRILFDPVPTPWKNFARHIQEKVDDLVVSSRVNKRLNGSLHKDTILSFPKDQNSDGSTVHHVRKAIESLSAGEVDAIVDPVIRSIVKKHLDASGLPPAKAFADEANRPHLIGKKDPTRVIPIRRVRIRKPDKPIAVGSGGSRRYVNPGSNHHMEIVTTLGDSGKESKWEGVLVSRFDAVTRRRNGSPIICREHSPKVFKFSLAGSEHVCMNYDGEGPKIYRVLAISDGQLEFVLHSDARPATIRRKTRGARVRCSPSKLQQYRAVKVVISPTGQVIPAND